MEMGCLDLQELLGRMKAELLASSGNTESELKKLEEMEKAMRKMRISS